MPNGAAAEGEFKDTLPGKVIALQKFETDADGNLTTKPATPDPNTRFVPILIDVPTLAPGFQATITYTSSGIQLWTLQSPIAAGNTQVSSGSTVSGSTTYYVEGLQLGQWRVDLKVGIPGDGAPSQSDEAMFNVVGENCGCCSSGTNIPSDGQLVVNQVYAGGAGSVVSTALSENSTSVSVTYTASPNDNDDLGQDQELQASATSQNQSIGDQPYLVFGGNAIFLVNGTDVRIFDYVSSLGTGNNQNPKPQLPWLARDNYYCDGTGTEQLLGNAQGTLVEQGGNLDETDQDGTQWVFSNTTGQVLDEIPPGGSGKVADYYSSGNDGYTAGQLETVTTDMGAGKTQVATYSYDPNTGTVIGATTELVPSDVDVSKVQYKHYGNVPGDANYGFAYDPSGSMGQVQSVTTYEYNSNGSMNTNAVDTEYYRYYTIDNYDSYIPTGLQSGPISEAGQLEFIFSDASLSRMNAAGINYLTASDTTVAPYADQYFQYNSTGQVAVNTVQGSGTNTYTYETNSSTPAVNVWSNEQAVSQTDGSMTTTYYNDAGDVTEQTISDTTRDSSTTSNTYNAAGNVLFSTQPSGLIDVDTYYATTTATATTAGRRRRLAVSNRRWRTGPNAIRDRQCRRSGIAIRGQLHRCARR